MIPQDPVGTSRGRRHARLLLLLALSVSPFAVSAEPPGAASCLGCHPSVAGNGPVPTLAGRKAADIINAMQAFRAGTLKATVMDRIAKGFSDEEIRAIADWYARGGDSKARS